MQEEEEMEASVDITTQIVGSYTGLSTFTDGGSLFTEEDRTATVTRSADSLANISINSVGGTISLVAQMSSETEFTIEDATVFTDGPFAGSGTVDGNTLDFLIIDGTINFEFNGEK